MSSSLRTIAQREVGQFPLSIGTSLAIEALVGTHPDNPNRHVGLDDIDVLYVNVRTLYRNLMNALGPNTRGSTHPEDVLAALNAEMKSLDDVVEKASKGRVEVNFYICRYESLDKTFPDAIIAFGKPRTKIQEVDYAHEVNTLRPFIRGVAKNQVEVFDIYPRAQGNSKRAMMLTHYPLDLVNRYDYSKLYLLESMTGKIKPHTQFSTKLRVQVDKVQVPFTVGTLQIFGDSGKLFGLQPHGLRDYVLEVALSGHWTAVTTSEKMLSNITQRKPDKYKELALKLLRA